MKRTLIVLWLCGLLPAVALGQETERVHGQGYFFVAPGAAVSTHGGSLGLVHFGTGLEANIYKGLGIGGEIGYMAPYQYMSEGVGIFSLNGLYMFRRPGSHKAIPFVTGGYTLAFRGWLAGSLNLGGGIHYWFSRRCGLRFEFRDHISTQAWSDHLLQARIAFEIR